MEDPGVGREGAGAGGGRKGDVEVPDRYEPTGVKVLHLAPDGEVGTPGVRVALVGGELSDPTARRLRTGLLRPDAAGGKGRRAGYQLVVVPLQDVVLVVAVVAVAVGIVNRGTVGEQ